MKRISFYIVIVLLGVSFFTSCEEQGLLTHTNDVSYIAFEKNMTTDTTGVSFKFYNEGENAKILLGVTISGKVQDKDLEFTVSVDPERTTLPATQYELPEKCVIRDIPKIIKFKATNSLRVSCLFCIFKHSPQKTV